MTNNARIRVGIAGATGYTGRELIRMLARHSGIELVSLAHGPNSPDECISVIYPELAGICNLDVKDCDTLIADDTLDAVFLALPHRAAMAVAKPLLERGVRVIDLSADYRLCDVGIYEQWYQVQHTDPQNLAHAVYGLCEYYRDRIRDARLIAVPGCYPTGALLPLLPLVGDNLVDRSRIIIDAKSGVSGAGKKVAPALQFMEVNESFKAYGIFAHRHTPEINQELTRAADGDVSVVFTPHLLPVQRGILSTIYVELRESISEDDIRAALQAAYDNEFFVRVKPAGASVELKHVVNTNFCDIGCVVDGKRAVLVSAIDNLVKGASGQALHCFNIMFAFPETEGLL
jgi:N-acetyl-gamma-glutamyl-phosphate reductase